MVFYPRVVAYLQFVLDDPAIELVPTTELSPFEKSEEEATPLPPHTVQVIPNRMRLSRNAYDEADTIELDVHYSAFPFDPRAARAIRIMVHMGVVDGPDGEFLSGEENLVFQGHADEGEWRIEDGNIIRLTGRDETALLLDLPWDGTQIPLNLGVEDLVRGIIAKYPSTAPMEVVLRGVASTTPAKQEEEEKAAASQEALKDLLPETALLPRNAENDSSEARSRAARQFGWHSYEKPAPAALEKPAPPPEKLTDVRDSTMQKMTGDRNESVWSVISRLCQIAGFVCWVDGRTIVIGPGQAFAVADDVVTSFVHGRNLMNLSVRRKFNSSAAPIVRIVSWSPDLAKTVSAQWPQEEPQESTGDGVPMQRKVVQLVYNQINDEDELLRIAKNVHHRFVRHNSLVQLKTRDLAGVDGESLLYLKAGHPIAIWIGDQDQQYLHQLPDFNQRVQFLVKQGYDGRIARAVAASYQWIPFVYQVLVAEYEWTTDGGITVSVEAGAYLGGTVGAQA